MPQQTIFPEYAPMQAIATRFGISRATLYRLIGKGTLKAEKVGRATRVVTASVEEYFANLPQLHSLGGRE